MTRKRRRRIFIGILFFFGLLIYANFTNGLARCVLYKDFELDKIHRYVYVDKSMTSDERQRLLNIYQKSTQRIEDFFGERRASSYLIAGNTSFAIQRYGNHAAQTGITHLSFLESYSIVDSAGLNIDVISHELCHAELRERVGWYRREFKIPTWFDEG